MKNKTLIILIIFISFLPFIIKAQDGKPFKCHIKGTVVDRPYSKLLYLTKQGADSRVSRIEIPIKDSAFEYELSAIYEEAYQLEFADEIENGSWMPINFMIEPGVIEMTLYPQDRHNENKLKGGAALTQIYLGYKEKTDSLFNFRALEKRRDELPNRGLTDEAYNIIQKAMKEENKQAKDSLYSKFQALEKARVIHSKAYQDIENLYRNLYSEFIKWETDYVKNNASLYGYSILLRKMRRAVKSENKDFPQYMDIANTIYKPKYPNHPYTQEIEQIAKSYYNIKVGGRYIDFTLPDFDGKNITLSEHINGKIALIDLWASWCGPCRRLSISMIPIYEEYKDKGFTILGVAREEARENAINAAQKDKYPWINLLELNDKAGIWKLYGVGNAGGSTFLVDKDGTILAIHPTADEVKKILSERLK